MKKIRIITATARNQIEFRQQTLLGQSLNLLLRQGDLEVSVIANNSGKARKSLAEIYNSFLQPKFAGEILLFVHDDVYIHDWHLVQRLADATAVYDVIGLAGNTNPDWEEPAWSLAWNRSKYPSGRQPKEYLSGVVGHLVHGHTHISSYGPTPQACKLLDGLFLAVDASKILEAGVHFDPQFEFHFYDLDFCRQCCCNGLKIGTWPIAVTHASPGRYNSPEWSAARDLYFNKWRTYNSSMQQTAQQALLVFRSGNFQEAARLCESVLSSDKDNLVAINVWGVICAQQGQLQQALELFSRAVQLKPDDAEAFNNQGNVLKELKRHEEALHSYQQALAIKPNYTEASFHQGLVLHDLKRYEEALASYDKALAAKPDLVIAMVNRGDILKAIGEHHAAIVSYREAISLAPEAATTRLKHLMAHIPVHGILEDDTQRLRTRFSEEIVEFSQWLSITPAADGHNAVGASQPFYLAYQEHNNKELISKYGDLCTFAMSRWQQKNSIVPVRSHSLSGSKIRLGIVSAHICNHPVWNAIVKGWFQQMDRSRFELHVFYLDTRQDMETEFAKNTSDTFVQGNKGIKEWATAILAQNVDALIYPELGMDAMTVKLASMRLAPLQIATWGHPETTGLSTIDYYLSADDMEPAEAQACYTEQLVRLPHLGCYYDDPNDMLEESTDLRALGIKTEEPLFVCPGTPYKYTPQHDQVFVDIARRLGKAQFIFFTHRRVPLLSERLHQRLAEAFSSVGLDASQYIAFIPKQPILRFHSIMKQADVFLDTLGFSGFNTAMQAVECGLPIITSEGRFMRGRFASAILKRMGMDELVCQDDEAYVERAVKLAQNPSYRDSLRRRMLDSRHVLYRDTAPIRALEYFLTQIVPKASNSDS